MKHFMLGAGLGLGIVVIVIAIMPPFIKAAEWWFAIWK